MGMQKVYTKTGDRGMTSLVSGEKVSKTDIRVEAYGCVDELNAYIGLLREAMMTEEKLAAVDLFLERIQHELFDIGCELASGAAPLRIEGVYDANIQRLEKEMDTWAQVLSPLSRFVLPGGHLINACAHVARTVCRRAERQILQVTAQGEAVRAEIMQYMNRLSDWLFVLSRWVIHLLGGKEVFWEPTRKPKS